MSPTTMIVEPPEGLDKRCAFDDPVLRQRTQEIIRERKIEVVVETGIYNGLSTTVLSQMVGVVIGIENNLDYIAKANGNFIATGCHNVVLVAGNSPAALSILMPLLPDATLFFLDAHWQLYWPVRDEIAALRLGSGVVLLHDVVVPGHPELGFDVYGGQAFDYEYVKPALVKWSPSHRIEYNDRAEAGPFGSYLNRGVMFAFPS